MATRERNLSIDMLKFLAVLLITNSHMDKLYGEYSVLATGGAIGDVLFFFCSGYTLFLGKLGRFDFWYKRRIRRIYPSVIALTIMGTFLWNFHRDMYYLITYGGEWFVSCIMIYYILLYFIRRYAIEYLNLMFFITLFITFIWYFFFYEDKNFISIYKWTHIKWCFYFLNMLLGAAVGLAESKNGYLINRNTPKESVGMNMGLLLFCIVLFYGIQILGKKSEMWAYWQIITIFPLFGINWFFYLLCCHNWVKRVFSSPKLAWVINAIGGLCLEIYLVQPYLFTTSMNKIFPLNLLIMFFIILLFAWFCRSLGKLFQQTFSSEEGYNWKEILKIV